MIGPVWVHVLLIAFPDFTEILALPYGISYVILLYGLF